jgi:hypothetical protein
MEYTLVWRNKFLTTQATSIGEMAKALEAAAQELREMEREGVTLKGQVADGHPVFVTTNFDVARKFGIEKEEADAEPPGGLPEHKQVPIAWEGRYAEVDEDLAPLILSLWKVGIDTSNSCQENLHDFAWVEFPTMVDAMKFVDLVAVFPDEGEVYTLSDHLFVGDASLWELSLGSFTGCGGDRHRQYGVNVHNRGVEEEVVRTCVGPSDFEFPVPIHFRREDLPLILERLQAGTTPEGVGHLPGRAGPGLSVPADGPTLNRNQEPEGGSTLPASARNCPGCGVRPGTEE